MNKSILLAAAKRVIMSDLTINEIEDKRLKLETELLGSISSLINDFQENNDVTVSYVSIGMTTDQQIQESKPRSIITGVDVGIDLN